MDLRVGEPFVWYRATVYGRFGPQQKHSLTQSWAAQWNLTRLCWTTTKRQINPHQKSLWSGIPVEGKKVWCGCSSRRLIAWSGKQVRTNRSLLRNVKLKIFDYFNRTISCCVINSSVIYQGFIDKTGEMSCRGAATARGPFTLLLAMFVLLATAAGTFIRFKLLHLLLFLCDSHPKNYVTTSVK